MRSTVSSFLLTCALFLGATGVSAIDFPTMKAGLWESTVTREGVAQKVGGTKMCMDTAVQKEMMEMGMGQMKAMCSKNDIRRDGNRVYGNVECKFGESMMKSSLNGSLGSIFIPLRTGGLKVEVRVGSWGG